MRYRKKRVLIHILGQGVLSTFILFLSFTWIGVALSGTTSTYGKTAFLFMPYFSIFFIFMLFSYLVFCGLIWGTTAAYRHWKCGKSQPADANRFSLITYWSWLPCFVLVLLLLVRRTLA